MLLVVGAVAVGWSVIAWMLEREPAPTVLMGSWTLVIPSRGVTYDLEFYDDGRFTDTDPSGQTNSGEWWMVRGQFHMRYEPLHERLWSVGRYFTPHEYRYDHSPAVFRIDVLADGNVDLVRVPSELAPQEYTLHLQRRRRRGRNGQTPPAGPVPLTIWRKRRYRIVGEMGNYKKTGDSRLPRVAWKSLDEFG